MSSSASHASHASPTGREAIVAIGTASGDGSRAMIRVSGEDVMAGLASAVGGPAHDLLAAGDRGVAAGRLRGRDDDRPGVPVLVATAPGPRSFTGEDVVEIQVPGRATLATRVRDDLVHRLESAGVPARLAGPGEFSARAFLAGRLSATEAMQIALAIDAERDEDLQAAGRLHDDEAGRRLTAIRERLVSLVARLEAGIDFTDEEDVVACTVAECEAACGSVLDDLGAIRGIFEAIGGDSDAAPRVVLTGPPNAGKSTLFNALVGADRAVVTDVAGTTRDVIEAVVRWPDPTGVAPDTVATLVDTAGVGASEDPLATAATDAVSRAIDAATVIVTCRPWGVDEPENETTAAPPADVACLAVWTKGDLVSSASLPAIEPNAIVVSARVGDGLDDLRQRIGTALADQARHRGGRGAATAIIGRLSRGLDEAIDQVRSVAATIGEVERRDAGVPMPEVVAAMLHAAIESIGELDGELDPDRVLDEVFGRFCVGK